MTPNDYLSLAPLYDNLLVLHKWMNNNTVELFYNRKAIDGLSWVVEDLLRKSTPFTPCEERYQEKLARLAVVSTDLAKSEKQRLEQIDANLKLVEIVGGLRTQLDDLQRRLDNLQSNYNALQKDHDRLEEENEALLEEVY